MLRCIELAEKGIGKTYPNPLVGCVIVNENKIISEKEYKVLLKDKTFAVNLVDAVKFYGTRIKQCCTILPTTSQLRTKETIR